MPPFLGWEFEGGQNMFLREIGIHLSDCTGS